MASLLQQCQKTVNISKHSILLLTSSGPETNSLWTNLSNGPSFQWLKDPIVKTVSLQMLIELRILRSGYLIICYVC